MYPVALCSYHPAVGWRLAAISFSDRPGVEIVRFGRIKLMRVVLKTSGKPGSFCNPRKLSAV